MYRRNAKEILVIAPMHALRLHHLYRAGLRAHPCRERCSQRATGTALGRRGACDSTARIQKEGMTCCVDRIAMGGPSGE